MASCSAWCAPAVCEGVISAHATYEPLNAFAIGLLVLALRR